MKNVLLKALGKANQKNMSVEDTADLIMDYLEIAGELGAQKETAAQPAVEPPPIVTPQKPKVVDINRAVNPKRPIGVSAWKVDELFSYLSKFDLSFETRPDGWDRDLAFRFNYVKEPNGMKGIGVVWQAVEDPSFKINYFFSLDDEDPNTETAIQEAKLSVNNILRKSDKVVVSSTVPLTSYPSDITGLAGFTGNV